MRRGVSLDRLRVSRVMPNSPSRSERFTKQVGASTEVHVFTRSFIDEEFLGVATESRNS